MPKNIRPTVPRRKACRRCIDSKRRCDLRRPVCERCSRRGGQCTYDFDTDDGGVEIAAAPGQREKAPSIESVFKDNEDDFKPLPYPSPDFAALTSLPPARLRYCARLVVDSVGEIVNDVQTSFIKRPSANQKWPKTLRDVYSACAVHSCRTDNNDVLVRELVLESYTRMMLSEDTQTVADDLARVQAVLLLHILLLFDGDIQFRSRAESQMDVIRSKVLSLQRLAEDDTCDGQERESYERWILMESVRRTILMATIVECIYMMLKEGSTRTVTFLSMLPITVSGGLWRARSEAEWRSVSSRVPLTVLPYGEALGFWKEEAAQDKLDGLQKLLLVSCKGQPAELPH